MADNNIMGTDKRKQEFIEILIISYFLVEILMGNMQDIELLNVSLEKTCIYTKIIK